MKKKDINKSLERQSKHDMGGENKTNTFKILVHSYCVEPNQLEYGWIPILMESEIRGRI